MTTNVYWAEAENLADVTNVYWAEAENEVGGDVATGSGDIPEITLVTLLGGGSALVGATVDLTATIKDQDEDPIPNLSGTVATSAAGVATVTLLAATDATGTATVRATAVGGGEADVTIAADGVQSVAQAVAVIEVTTVTLNVPTISLEIGTTGSASVTVRDQNAAAVSGVTVTWASSSAPVIASPAATVTGATGTTTVSLPALAAGTTTITATCETVASAGIVVTVFAVAEAPTYSAEGSAQIVVTAESRLAGWERPKIRRFNDADQKKTYPTDRFFEGMAESGESEIVWPSAALLRRLG